MHTISSVFPSVTGPAYAPFVMGMHPGSVGLPGLRWYDRARLTAGWPGYARSYAGIDLRHMNGDLSPESRTIFELADSSVGALSVIGRGLARGDSIGRSAAFAARTAITHFRGDIGGWLDIDRRVADELVRRVERDRPRYVFAAFTGIDKTSHAAGHESAPVMEALRIVDDVTARIRADAERAQRWDVTHVWVVSDHGHSSVTRHDDIDAVVGGMGYRVLSHPWIFTRAPDVAVMVSGNAMAHVYVDLDRRDRAFWAALNDRWSALADALLARDSVDLLLVPLSRSSCEVRSRDRGTGLVQWCGDHYSYRTTGGDPLAIGAHDDLTGDASHEITIGSDYPDALVQIARLVECDRSGDLIMSAARGWDFRARYEPIPHVSSHGAMHREHMLVPLLTNHPLRSAPRRTVDVLPSACTALGIEVPEVEGRSFL